MVALLADGTTKKLANGVLRTTAGLQEGMASYTASEASKITTFLSQRRPYQWVEFRNVSMQPGHATTVVVKDFGGENKTEAELTASLKEDAARTNELSTRRAAPAKENTLTFGPETNGLRAAVELTASNGVFMLGEPIDVRFHVLNASGTNIYVAGGSWRQDEAGVLTITDEQGQKLTVHHIWYSGWTPLQRNFLQPGERTLFRSSSVEFLAEDADESKVTHPVGNYVKVKPGRYKLSYKPHFPDIMEGDAPKPYDWQGDLETAPVTVEVKAPATPAAAQNVSFGPVIERVVNDNGRDVFLDLDTGKLMDDPDDHFQTSEVMKGDIAADVIEWTSSNGVDLLLRWEKQGPHIKMPAVLADDIDFGKMLAFHMRSCDMVLIFTNAEAWADLSARDVVTQMMSAQPNGPWNMLNDTPSTNNNAWIFRTRDGGMGILQITGFTDNPRGVKIRYKLVQNSIGSSTSAMIIPVTAQTVELEFRLVADEDDTRTPADELSDPKDRTGQTKLRVLKEVLLDSSAVASASLETHPTEGKSISVVLKSDAAQRFSDITSTNIGRRLAIVWRGRVLSLPMIFTKTTGPAISVSGKLSDAEWQVLLDLLNFKSAPAATSQSTNRVQAPTALLEPADLREAKAKLTELFTNNPALQSQLKRVEELVRLSREEPNASADLREAKAHLAELRVDYAEQHPLVQEALARVKALEGK
jgi:hypothetical protein